MNLCDLLDSEGLIVDSEDNLIGNTFGKKNQLTVIGHSGRKGTNKLYILYCSECSKDPELWGEGYFAYRKSELCRGLMPCGCGKNVNYTEDQWKVRILRKLSEFDVKYKFIDWVNGFKNSKKTYMLLECPKHGIWNTTTIDRLINYSATCKGCANETLSERASKDEDEIIKSFFDSGSFTKGTVFCRSERLSTRGWKLYWKMYCPICKTISEAQISSYQSGFMSCECSRNRALYSYLNVICDNGIPIALKFGVCNNLPKRRLSQQKRLSVYDVYNYAMWKFKSRDDCISAENECYSLGANVLTKEEFPDGYTETRSVTNFENILSIFSKYSGQIVYRGEYNGLS